MRKIARKPTPGLDFSDLTGGLWLNYPLNLQSRLFCAVALSGPAESRLRLAVAPASTFIN
ncbi:hypothetical protein [Polaromonas hydrogenivorans]|uniref:Uncharacterized protein n=1 Tax=Polaromonas hydrogenivorans TaxID=335476 RepID=A0AAU7M0G0_9BURK